MLRDSHCLETWGEGHSHIVLIANSRFVNFSEESQIFKIVSILREMYVTCISLREMMADSFIHDS